MKKRSSTKIICTLGPATNSFESIERLLLSGMSIARLNMSHGTKEEYVRIISVIRLVERKHNTKLFIAIDTCGPELRIYTKETLQINENDLITIVPQEDYSKHLKTSKTLICVNLDNFESINKDGLISLDDSKLFMKIKHLEDRLIYATALSEYTLKSGKRIKFDSVEGKHVFLNEKDKEDIAFAILNRLDAIFVSFVESLEDIIQVKDIITDKTIQIIAKIESKKGVDNIQEIEKVSDGIMVARGDLMNDVFFNNLFSIQKLLCRKIMVKPIIMATEMLQSMTNTKTPLRAEVSDIGNAILDNCSATMLSSETAVGRYPDISVDTMRLICIDAENYMSLLNKEPLAAITFVDWTGDMCRILMLRRSVYFIKHEDI
ncbi:hypothetical protein GINT2_000318 [Glugoides intestinalis]